MVALDNVSFNINKGEIVGLIGPNGAGKTTMLNCITGFYRIDSGVIRYKGKKLNNLKPHKICSMGIGRTFQIVKTFENTSVLENVMVGAFLKTNAKAVAEQKAMKMLEIVGLREKKDEIVRNLTIVDKKRLELARALATEPELLLLDEIAAGLNPAEVTELIAKLKEIRNIGITLLIIEHVLELVMSISDRIIVLHHGRKIADAKPSTIIKDKRVIEAYLGEGCDA